MATNFRWYTHLLRTKMFKSNLDWQSAQIVSIYDDLSLWSAQFGLPLLEHLPLQNVRTIVDIGFGTGFPLVEISQRLSVDTQVFGVDIWPAAIELTKRKLQLLNLNHVQIIQQPAHQFTLPKNTIDLVCSNLGVNNFNHPLQVYSNIFRMLRPNGKFCFTTNTKHTFKELFTLFETAMQQLQLDTYLLDNYVASRPDVDSLQNDLKMIGFVLRKKVEKTAYLSFYDAMALFNHSLIRIAFRSSWDAIIPRGKHNIFYTLVMKLVDEIIVKFGQFKLTVPILYLEVEKPKI